jgi:hypothetical protein
VITTAVCEGATTGVAQSPSAAFVPKGLSSPLAWEQELNPMGAKGCRIGYKSPWGAGPAHGPGPK